MQRIITPFLVYSTSGGCDMMRPAGRFTGHPPDFRRAPTERVG